MKIGIITQPLHNNYGGILQNYALQFTLKKLGYDVETLDWSPAKSNTIKEWIFSTFKNVFSNYIKGVKKPPYRLTDNEKKIIGRNTYGFIKKYITLCPRQANRIEDFCEIDDLYKYDAYIVGSDQVWRPLYNPGMQPAMFLSFVKRERIKRISYAASFGTSGWEFSPQLTAICSKLVQKFDLITVREKTGLYLCKDYLGAEAIQVLDPTLLLNCKDYEQIVKEEGEQISQGNLFYYILDPNEEKNKFIEIVASKCGLKPFTVMPKCQAENRTKWDVKHRIEDCVFPSVTSWLRGFMDAELVIVDSFHGAVFSIIFNKQFWVIGNSKRGNSRFESLLSLFGLEDRLIDPTENINIKQKIDWDLVNEIRKKEQIRCVGLLNEILVSKG